MYTCEAGRVGGDDSVEGTEARHQKSKATEVDHLDRRQANQLLAPGQHLLYCPRIRECESSCSTNLSQSLSRLILSKPPCWRSEVYTDAVSGWPRCLRDKEEDGCVLIVPSEYVFREAN